MEERAYGVFQRKFGLITRSNVDPAWLAGELLAAGIIANVDFQRASNPHEVKDDRLAGLVQTVMRNGAPDVFQTFVSILLKENSVKWLGEKLKADFESVGGVWRKEPNLPESPDFRKFGEPNLQSLTNLVGMRVRNKWYAIGIGLGVEATDLNSFQTEEAGKPDANQHCMRRVFQKWHTAATSDYTWQNLARVLESPAVNEKLAMSELFKSLCEPQSN